MIHYNIRKHPCKMQLVPTAGGPGIWKDPEDPTPGGPRHATHPKETRNCNASMQKNPPSLSTRHFHFGSTRAIFLSRDVHRVAPGPLPPETGDRALNATLYTRVGTEVEAEMDPFVRTQKRRVFIIGRFPILGRLPRMSSLRSPVCLMIAPHFICANLRFPHCL